MSATLLNIDHIDLLVSACVRLDMQAVYVELPGGEAALFDCTKDTDWTGAILVNENVRSVTHKAPDEDFDSLPGPTRRVMPEDYRFTEVSEDDYSWLDVLKACDGYEFNSCDHRGYENSRARQIVQAIRRNSITNLDGYADSKAWSFKRPASV